MSSLPPVSPDPTPALVSEASELFNRIDTSGDGFLQRNELSQLAKWLLARVSTTPAPPSRRKIEAESRRLLAVMDTDRSVGLAVDGIRVGVGA